MDKVMRYLIISLPAWGVSGCGWEQQPVDLFAELSQNAYYSTPTCPEIKKKDGKYRNLRDVKVFSGPNWELLEMNKVTAEDDRVIFSLWTPRPDFLHLNYWVIWCQYDGLEDAVEINLPNGTRYCISMLVKENPPRQPQNMAFWCVPSLIPGVDPGPSPDYFTEEDDDR